MRKNYKLVVKANAILSSGAVEKLQDIFKKSRTSPVIVIDGSVKLFVIKNDGSVIEVDSDKAEK